MPTIGEAVHAAAQRLREAAEEDARLEAEVLLAHATGVDRTHVLARLHDQLAVEDTRAFDTLIARRAAREPLAYIVGRREFYGIDIICAPGALIPRPETEMLVDLALEEIERRGRDVRIVDVGTGSGAIAVAIAANAPDMRIVASDASDAALAIARRNVEAHGLAARVTLRRASLLEDAGMCDVIVANLPYVSEREWAELQPEIREHEPRESLVGGETGAEVIEQLIAQAPAHVAASGVLAAEIGETQSERLLSCARRFYPDADAYGMKDFAGRDRVLVVRREEAGRE
jgi:release factor glutamine methyltransferase